MPIATDLQKVRDSCQRFLEALGMLEKDRRLAPMVKKLERALASYFREQGRLFLEGLDGVSHTYPQVEATRPSDFAEWWWEYIEWWNYLDAAMKSTIRLFVDPVDEAVMAAYLLGGQVLIAELQIPLTFSLRNPRAISYLEQYGARLVTNIDETTREYIRKVLVRGRDEGWSYDKVAKAITDRYEEFAVGRPQEHIQSRAHLIAVTEIGNAYEQANLDAALELEERGIPMEKFWLNVGDDRVSDGCRANTAAGWIPIDAEFPAEATTPAGKMRPLRFPGCRCTALYQRMKAA